MNFRSTDLYLHEEITLLALKDREGTFYMRNYAPAIAGAILAEMLLTGRIALDEGKRKLVNLVRDEPFGDDVLDEALGKIRTAKRRADMRTWVQRFQMLPKLSHRVAQGLCRRGVLRENEQKILLLFKQKTYPELDHGFEQRTIWKLQEAIFGASLEIDPRVVVLVALARAADLLNLNFDRRELREKRKRIKTIITGNLIGEATKEAIDAAHAAVAVAAMVPIIAATASTSSH